MLHSLHRPALALLLATGTALAPAAHAGADLNSSEYVALISVFVVVSAPLAVSTDLVKMSAAPFKRGSSRGSAPREKAGELPPMEVKDVESAPGGDWKVHLQVPGRDDHTATLAWPAREDAPAAAFVVGEQVRFVPTDTGAGWNIQNADGKTLAYAPTAYAAQDSSSELW